MAAGGGVSGRKLADELRRLRRLSGLSGRELGALIDISQSTVSRIESGTTLPSLVDVQAWAAAVSATARQRRWLTACADAAFTEVDTWRSRLRNRDHVQDEVQLRESGARLLQVFQPSVVPGLLQTAEYARRVFKLFRPVPYTDEALSAAVAGRLSRQLALYEENRRFEFLITEAALRWRPGPVPLLLRQLDQIASVSSLGNVSVGLIPQDVEAVTYSSHGFVINSGSDPQVTVEAIHGTLTVRGDEDIQLYRDRWEQLREMAHFGEAAPAFLGRLRAELSSRENLT